MESMMRHQRAPITWAWALLLLTTPLTACLEDPEASPDCDPGASRPAADGCNTCQCTEEGDWACTDLACLPQQCGGDAGAACEAVFDACACAWRCGALPDGAPMACDRDCDAIAEAAPVCECADGQCREAEACLPGTLRPAPDGCNTCTCTEEGEWACTDLACPAPLCEDGDNSCVAAFNSCTCSYVCLPGGLDLSDPCPERACPAVVVPVPGCGCVDGVCTPEPRACEPGTERPADDGCNTCTCTDEGAWACTDRACPEPICVDDAGCAPVYDICNCHWRCLPPGEVPEACPGVEPCPAPDPDAALQCACQEGQCVSRAAPECAPG